MDRTVAVIRILLISVAGYLLFLVACAVFQRKLTYFPSHHKQSNGLQTWTHQGQLIGYARQVTTPRAVWLFMHGNAGQAADRSYILPSLPATDSIYILEYPGYGSRPGSPSMASFNASAQQAYALLKTRYPDLAVCVAAESIGTGPASFLATLPDPPARIVLISPFDRLADVAARHYPFLPVKLLMRDKWDNIAALRSYNQRIDLFAAKSDTIIPLAHARALAASRPSAKLHIIEGDHNDWANGDKVRIGN